MFHIESTYRNFYVRDTELDKQLMITIEEIIERISYEDYSNKQLLLLPISLLFLAIIVILGFTIVTGSPVILGVDFVGGSELRLSPDSSMTDPSSELSGTFAEEPSSIQQVPADGTYIVTFRDSGVDISDLESDAEAAGFTVESSSSISGTFGSDSQQIAIVGLLFAFLGMSVVVYGLFRSFVPSIAVVASAFSDIIIPVAMMNLVGIEMTLGTVAALLMLIGYSVDSDMLLNDYVVRRGGDYYEQVYTAMDTGITMTLTSFIAMAIMAVSATILGVPLLRDIGIIIAFGLAVDVMNTYLMNVTLLRWFRFNKGDLL